MSGIEGSFPQQDDLSRADLAGHAPWDHHSHYVCRHLRFSTLCERPYVVNWTPFQDCYMNETVSNSVRVLFLFFFFGSHGRLCENGEKTCKLKMNSYALFELLTTTRGKDGGKTKTQQNRIK